jgi:hypothetical protein
LHTGRCGGMKYRERERVCVVVVVMQQLWLFPPPSRLPAGTVTAIDSAVAVSPAAAAAAAAVRRTSRRLPQLCWTARLRQSSSLLMFQQSQPTGVLPSSLARTLTKLSRTRTRTCSSRCAVEQGERTAMWRWLSSSCPTHMCLISSVHACSGQLQCHRRDICHQPVG